MTTHISKGADKAEKFAERHRILNSFAATFRKVYNYSPRKAAFFARVAYDRQRAAERRAA